jgi:hypothetical protein
VRQHRRQVFVFVALITCAIALTAQSSSAQIAREDSVTGSGNAGFFGSFTIDARSGPSGESPSGSVSVAGAVSFDGPVTCLAVGDNVATLNIQTMQFGLVTMKVTDDAPDVIEANTTSRTPGDCSPFEGGIAGTVTSGDVVVVDALVLPVATSKNDCRAGGWRSVVDDAGEGFRNQGQCISFVVHHRGA